MFEYKLGPRHLYAPADGKALFTNNETNAERLYGSPSVSPYVKDAFHRHIVNGEKAAVNPDAHGTKSALHFKAMVPAARSTVWHLRLTPEILADPLGTVESIVVERRAEADD